MKKPKNFLNSWDLKRSIKTKFIICLEENSKELQLIEHWNLDSHASEAIYNIFRDINKTFGTTFIIITHDERIAIKTDRVIEIKGGIITS